MSQKRKRKIIRAIFILIIVGVLIGAFIGKRAYQRIMKPNVFIEEESSGLIYIPTGSALNDVLNILEESGYVINISHFKWVADKKNYRTKIHPGCYKLTNSMNNNELVNLLRIGSQQPVKVTFNNVRTLDKFASVISRQIEPDSITIYEVITDSALLDSLGFTIETVPAIFIPNTYEFWWNTKAESFVLRMHKEYKRFWNDTRLQKANAINMSPEEVTTLASIVEQETNKKDEMPIIAGVYLNRIGTRIPLQADPTIKFALGDFTIKRVLTKHLDIKSPYNTYKNYGLPPGPISFPSIPAIESVLNYEKHDYLYFCAKPDFSGYHNFAKTLRQHNVNARDYQRALNQERIWR